MVYNIAKKVCFMAQMVAFSIRMDEDLKAQFETLCNEFGMSMTTAFNVFARAVVRERRIPFEICVEPEKTKEQMRSKNNKRI